MAVSVGPTITRPTHDLSLGDGTTTLGLILCDGSGNHNPRAIRREALPRSSIKTYAGEQTHADLEPPYTPVSQDDWSGGRGGEDFDDDKTKYNDGWRTDTIKLNRAVLGPQECYTTGMRSGDIHMPYKGAVTNTGITYNYTTLTGTTRYMAYTFAASASYTAITIWLLTRKTGTPGTLTVELCADNAGVPGTVLATATTGASSAEANVNEYKKFTVSQALTTGTSYWLKVYGAATDDASNYWQVQCETITSGTNGRKSANGSSWSTSNEMYFRILSAEKPCKTHFFVYKEALYCALSYDDGAASKVFLNGEAGVATSGSANTLSDSTKAWTTNEWAGSVVVLFVGTGSAAATRYRTITGNTGTQLTVSPDWDVNPASGSEYIILNSDKWTEITGHGMSGRVTDVLSLWHIGYFAMGDSEDLKRMRRYTSGGAWTTEWVTETGNKASFLRACNFTDGAVKVWKGNLDYPAQISRADAVWGGGAGAVSNLSFGTAIDVGDVTERITGLEVYDEPQTLYCFKEGGVVVMDGDTPGEIPLREMRAVKSETNGRASLVHNLYLYFSVLKSWQRYYKSNLDDQGLWDGAGFPNGRQGYVVAAIGYPGRYYIAVDGRDSNYSYVLANNGAGWHEIYRGPEAGVRIRNVFIQPIPGDAVDRLWISQGSDAIWLPIDLNPLRAYGDTQANSYHYTSESHLITSYYYLGLQDVSKLYHSLKVVADTLGATCMLKVDYRTDDATAWTEISGTFDSMGEEIELASANNVTGKRIQFRLRLRTLDNTQTPVLRATVLEAVTRVPHKFAYTLTFRVADQEHDLNGNPDDVIAADTKIDQLDAWASSAAPITLNGNSNFYHGKTVLLQPVPVQQLRKVTIEGREYQVCQATAMEL